MDGPDILVRTLSQRTIPDQFGNLWQYHSRSNRRVSVAYWAVLFDLLRSKRNRIEVVWAIGGQSSLFTR